MNSDFDMGDLPPLDDILSDAGMGEKERVVDPNADRDVILVCEPDYDLERVLEHNPRARPILNSSSAKSEYGCERLARFVRNLSRANPEKEIYVVYSAQYSHRFKLSEHILDLLNVFPLFFSTCNVGYNGPYKGFGEFEKKIIDRSCRLRHT